MKKFILLLMLLPFVVLSQQIDNFTPTTASGGIGDVLTINGSGFGSMDSSDRVYIGSQFAVPPVEVLSWTDNQIVCKVHKDAQSGTVRVLNDGVTTTSNNTITIRYTIYNAYNQLTNSYQVPKLKDEYHFMVHGFSQNGLNRLQAAIDAWGCATGYRFSYEVSDINYGLNNDNVCSIYVAPGAGGAGTLPRWKECGEYTYLNEVDIRFDDATPPYYYILHELGHAAGLSHHFGGSVMGGSNSITSLDEEAISKVFELGNIPTECTTPMQYDDCFALSLEDNNFTEKTPIKIEYFDILGRKIINPKPNHIYIVRKYYEGGLTQITKIIYKQTF